MTKIRTFLSFFGLLFLLFLKGPSYSQCTNTSAYLTEPAPTNSTTVTISTCTYQDEYNTISNVVAGETYVSDNDCGGYITVHSGTYNGPVVASGNAPLTWTASVNGDHFVHYNTNSSCGTATSCCTTTITCTSCTSSGCINTSSYGSASAPTGTSTVTISTCTYQDEYNTISNVVAGETYESGSDCGGFITVRSGTYDGPVVADGNAPLTWTASVNGDHFIHYNTNSSCGTATSCCTTTITCTSCSGGGGGCSDQTVNTTTFSQTGLSTCGFGDDFSSSDACASSYMGGDDYVFEYNPDVDGCVEIALTGTGSYTGVFLTDECPSSGTATCIGQATESGGNPTLSNMTVTAGQTYYITVSTWPSPQCTAFDIDVTSCPVSCNDGIQNQGETGVDCGGPCPSCSTIMPAACSNTTEYVNASSTADYIDDGGPGGDPCASGAAGNFCNCGCITTTTICAAPGEYLIADFSVFAMYNTTSGFDWMVIYDGATTSDPILFDNRSGGPDNPLGDCNYDGSSNYFCATGRCLTFEFNQTGVVNRAGWEAEVTSTPSPCTPLPVELLEFKGDCEEGKISLQWKTASEQGNEKFEIHRSIDGKEFKKVGEVEGNGTTNSTSKYSWMDPERSSQTQYYKLVQVDVDGDLNESESIAMEGCNSSIKQPSISVSQNGSSHPSLQIINNEKQFYSISIMDPRGKIIKQFTTEKFTGTKTFPLPPDIPQGIYFVTAISGEKRYVKKVIVSG